MVIVGTTRICTRKNYPVWAGIALGFFGQVFGGVLATFLVGVAAAFVPELMGLIYLTFLVRILAPILIANWLPFADNSQELLVDPRSSGGSVRLCPNCNRSLASTTKICPRCMNRILGSPAESPPSTMHSDDGNPYAPPRHESLISDNDHWSVERLQDPAGSLQTFVDGTHQSRSEQPSLAFCSVCNSDVEIDADYRCKVCRWPVDD